ncbi:hypothetical protein [Campylobacter sp. RM12647]|uniref:hypothetical protein n=1 Tax=Campylobacter sp. RM12647 TaxID=2735737 RepID=UPI001E04ED42|nr:hypothetical protein [Campylobacter sp. RM12647]
MYMLFAKSSKSLSLAVLLKSAKALSKSHANFTGTAKAPIWAKLPLSSSLKFF